VRFAKTYQTETNLDLSKFLQRAGVAYFLATFLLCCVLVFSYFTLKRILVEQTSLYSLQNATSELWLAIQDSSVYLSDLKEVNKDEIGESLIIEKITTRLTGSLGDINAAIDKTKERLVDIQKYSYSQKFNDRFTSHPYNIWLKLEQYTTRIEDITNQGEMSASTATSLWLPVEATSAKSGTLGKNYWIALDELNDIISAKSDKLRQTHYRLTLLSIGIALLELVLIFIPLQRYLAKSTNRLRKAHKKLDTLAHYDEATKLCNLTGMARQISMRTDNAYFIDLTIISITNPEDVAHIIGPENMPEFYKRLSVRINHLIPIDGALFRPGESQFGILLTSTSNGVLENLTRSLNDRLPSKLLVGNSFVYPEFRCGRSDGRILSKNIASKTIDANFASKFYEIKTDVIPLFHRDMRRNIEVDNRLIDDIRTAIANKEFVPFYQLKVDSQTTKITGMEALCRWVKPDGSMVFPDKFIDCAERSGLMVEMTWLLLDQIVEDYKYWCDAGLSPGRIAFNASESFLLEADFEERIARVVAKFGDVPCPLDLEVTESVALTSKVDAVTASIAAARNLGIRIALDDFGTGFASLSSITTLEIDTIKVDRSFVCVLDTNVNSRNVVASIIQLCRQLNIKCVVEGVETESEWVFCRDLACDEIQGYYFYKPESMHKVTESLQEDQQLRDVG